MGVQGAAENPVLALHDLRRAKSAASAQVSEVQASTYYETLWDVGLAVDYCSAIKDGVNADSIGLVDGLLKVSREPESGGLTLDHTHILSPVSIQMNNT